MIRRYFLIFYLQLLKNILQIKKTFYAILLAIKKNIFIHYLSIKILAPFSWKKRIALLEFNKKYEQVIKQCKQRLKKDTPDEPYLYEILARNFRNLNKIDEALFYLNKLKNTNYNSGSVYYEQGLIYFINRDYLKAKESLEYAIQQGYNTAPLQIHLGKIYYQLGLHDLAKNCFRRILEIYPKEGSIHFLLGIVLKNKQLYNEAEISFLRAIKYGSNHKEEHLGLAEIYTRQGKWDKAIQEYNYIAHIDPKSFIAHYFLGLLYEMRGKDSEAIKELIIANKINPGDDDTKEKLTKLLESSPQ